MPWRRKWQLTPVFLAWRSPWAEESCGLQSMGLQRVRHDWATEHTHNGNKPWPGKGVQATWWKTLGAGGLHVGSFSQLWGFPLTPPLVSKDWVPPSSRGKTLGWGVGRTGSRALCPGWGCSGFPLGLQPLDTIGQQGWKENLEGLNDPGNLRFSLLCVATQQGFAWLVDEIYASDGNSVPLYF